MIAIFYFLNITVIVNVTVYRDTNEEFEDGHGPTH